MAIKVTIIIADNRWAKHPYRVEFNDSACEKKIRE